MRFEVGFEQAHWCSIDEKFSEKGGERSKMGTKTKTKTRAGAGEKEANGSFS